MDNIKMNLKEIRVECVICIHVAQDKDYWWALANKVMSHWVLLNAGNFFSGSVTYIGISRMTNLYGVS